MRNSRDAGEEAMRHTLLHVLMIALLSAPAWGQDPAPATQEPPRDRSIGSVARYARGDDYVYRPLY